MARKKITIKDAAKYLGSADFHLKLNRAIAKYKREMED